MSAGICLKEAVIAAMENIEQLAGCFDGPPPRAPLPYLTIDAGTELDWSHKTGNGREVLLALTIWDDQPARLERLSDAVEAAMLKVASVTSWTLVNMVFQRRRVVRDVAGPWAAAIDYRARLLQIQEGEEDAR